MHETARRVLGNDDDASDCVHDVLLRVWQRDSTYRPERGALRTYLIIAVRNEAISRVRRTRRHAEIERLSANAQPLTYDMEPPDSVDLARLRRALNGLPQEQRIAIELAYRAGLTHTQIAEQLCVPLGTVKSRLVLAMRKLSVALR